MEERTEVHGIIMIRRNCSLCCTSFLISEKDTKTSHCSSHCKSSDKSVIKEKNGWNAKMRKPGYGRRKPGSPVIAIDW